MNELFRMNEYGDIWQEPTLFDQDESTLTRLTMLTNVSALPRSGHAGPT